MEHLHKKHKCQSFAFVGGPYKNAENIIRVQSYENCIKKWGLDISRNPVTYGSFEMSAGETYFEEVYKSKTELPDAFVCANDNIAAGLIKKAQEYGYNIPRDFSVTGFDNLDKSICFNPQITTVAHQREELSFQTMKMIDDIISGKEVEKKRFVEPVISYTESCGCNFSMPIDYREYVKESIVQIEQQRRFDEKRANLEAQLISAREFEEIFALMGDYFNQLDCDGITLVMDDRLLNLAPEQEFETKGYDINHLVVTYGSQVKKKAQYQKYEKYLEEEQNRPGDVDMFSPFHFKDYGFGFAILKNGTFLYDNPYYYEVLSLMNRVIWNMYQEKRIIEVNRRLDELYKRDPLTGLYNRIAYYDMVEPMIEQYKKEGRSCLISFFDCDNFKKINDELGHDAGDELLKRIGKILSSFVKTSGLAFRFGGDEFVLVKDCESMTEGKLLEQDIMDRFEFEKISVSIGSCVTENNEKTLKDYVNVADEIMYERKRKKKHDKMVEK